MENGTPVFGLVVGTRGCFNAKLATAGRASLLARMEALGYGFRILPTDATPTGVVEGREDGMKCARLFQAHRDVIDGIVVVLPNFGDELGIVNAVKHAKLDVPVLLQACDDHLDKLSTAERRDAFCGKISVANNFRQYGVPFTDTTTFSCELEGEAFTADLRRFEKICRVHRGLRNARIGAVGARPTDFQTMRSSEKILQAAGITVVTCDLSEILGEANRLDDRAAAVGAKVGEIREYGRVVRDAKTEHVTRQAKFGVALDAWIAKHDVQAAGIQCWTSMQQNFGCASCLSMSMLGDRLVPCACETDVTGVISMYALTLATGNASALLDWNNNYGTDREMCVCTHCSNFPRSFVYGKESREKLEISYLDVLGTTLGHDNCFGAVKGKVRAGDMTYFRISTDDLAGQVKAYLGEGQFTDDPFEMSGGIAVCRVPELPKLLRHIVKNGFEHHVGMARGRCADVIQEVLETYLGWPLHRHA
jgi:L-fucose isomerase-like protein